MRAALHLMTANDYVRLRPALQPALTRAMESAAGKRLEGLDIDRLANAARAYSEEEPRTFAELRPWLVRIGPDRDPSALAYTVRTRLPLVQVPSGGRWGFPGNAPFTTAESWLGRTLPVSGDPRGLVRRYLAAFGPATVAGLQKWSGSDRLKVFVEEMKPGLRLFRDKSGKELLDLPDAPLPPAETSAPVRFVPDYDNLVLAHAGRRRMIADEYRSRIFLSAARVRATFLVDGFVQGVWKIENNRGTATLVIEPFIALPRKDRDALSEEGERLVRFVEDSAKRYEVRFAEQISA